MTRRKTGLSGTNGKRSLGLIAVMLLVGLLVAGLTTASAGAGGSSATAAKKKKKTCPAGTQKVTVKKHGKKKKKCVPIPVTPAPTPAGTATLAISPTSFTYPTIQHNSCSAPPADADCTVKAFTVTNTGAGASGVPATSIVEVNNPIPGDPPGFVISTNTCTAAVPPGGSCTVGVYFKPNSSANPQPYTAVLLVTASSGGNATASLTGTAN
jgi:hypothetical protein